MYTRPARPASYARTDPQTGVRITIEPSQSAYFAGEPFTCIITFSNVRAGELTKPRPIGGNVKTLSPSAVNDGHDLPPILGRTAVTTTTTTAVHKHKRSSHSVSSVPLARPPTSPGTPKTAAPFYGSSGLGVGVAPEESNELRKKGLIGRTSENGEKEKEKKRLGRSMSLSVDAEEALFTPTSPSPLSPKREADLPVSHPHARKPSMAGPASLLSPDIISTTNQNALSTIYENSSSPAYATHPYSAPSTPSGTRFTKVVSVVPQPSLAGLSAISHNVHPHSAFATTFSPLSTELVLYAYAQLSGAFNIDPVAVHNAPEMYTLRDSLRNGRVGGGSLDFVVGSNAGGKGHRRGTSWFGLGGLFGNGGADAGGGSGGKGVGGTSGLGGGADDLPTLETQPSLIATDLRLAPGESKSYTYTIDLPSNLPPTFKGRAMRFSYELIVGTCRASSGLVPGNIQTSKVMRVPIRIYNHVSVDSLSHPYDLLWPISKRREKAVAGVVKEAKRHMHEVNIDRVSKRIPSQPNASPPSDPSTNHNIQALKLYARRLLANDSTLEEDNDCENESERAHGFNASSDGTDSGLGITAGGTGGLTGCREAVEIVTRNTRKTSYDITKENSKVAELTFVKSAYRLGESVQVVVEFNNDACTSKVLKISSTLESHEYPPWHSHNPSETIRRIHAEYYSSGTINSKRVAFSLDIPSDGSPGFQVFVGDKELSTKGSHEWKVKLCLLIAVSGSGKGNTNGSSSTSLSSTVASSKGKNKRIEIRNIRRDDLSDDEMDTNRVETNSWGKAWKIVSPMERVTPARSLQTPVNNATTSPASSTSTSLKRSDTTPTGLGFTSTASKGLSAWVGIFNAVAAGTYHDADEEIDENDQGAGRGREKRAGGDADEDKDDDEDEWVQMNVETVECLLPLSVYPGNTAYRPVEVVFEV